MYLYYLLKNVIIYLTYTYVFTVFKFSTYSIVAFGFVISLNIDALNKQMI